MNTEGARELLKQAGRFLQPYFQTGIKIDQAVFLNDVFREKGWGEKAFRVRYDRSQFTTDENYRTAYLTASFYAIHHRDEWRSIFKRDEKTNTFQLIETVLQGLISAWQNLKAVLVSA
jgi:hypothetical protein